MSYGTERDFSEAKKGEAAVLEIIDGPITLRQLWRVAHYDRAKAAAIAAEFGLNLSELAPETPTMT